MDRKMRARANNAKAKATRESRSQRIGVVVAKQDSGTEICTAIFSTPEGEIEPVKILIDHETKEFVSLPEPEEMN